MVPISELPMPFSRSSSHSWWLWGRTISVSIGSAVFYRLTLLAAGPSPSAGAGASAGSAGAGVVSIRARRAAAATRARMEAACAMRRWAVASAPGAPVGSGGNTLSRVAVPSRRALASPRSSMTMRASISSRRAAPR